MAQEFNTEVSKQLDAIIELGQEDVFGKMKAGLEATVEVAKETGSASLIKTAEASQEAADTTIRVFQSLLDSVQRYSEYNKKIEAALG